MNLADQIYTAARGWRELGIDVVAEIPMAQGTLTYGKVRRPVVVREELQLHNASGILRAPRHKWHRYHTTHYDILYCPDGRTGLPAEEAVAYHPEIVMRLPELDAELGRAIEIAIQETRAASAKCREFAEALREN